MLKNLGVVEVRCRPDGLGWLARQLGGKPLLEWVVRRVTDCQQLDGVIVLCGDGPADRRIASLVPLDVPVFHGAEDDSLGRFCAAVEQYPTEAVVRVQADSPFVDPMLIDRLVTTSQTHPECDYVSYCCRDGRPAILSPVGMYAEWFRVTALRRASRRATTPPDRQDVTSCFCSHPERFRLRLIPIPGQMDRDNVRLTMDIEEDWDHALAIFEALGPEELDWQRIAKLLDHQPAMRSRMAALNRARAKG